jgi:hypothetical protein
VAAKATGLRTWLLSLAALVLVAAIVLVTWAWIRPTPRGTDAPPPVRPASLAAVAAPAGGVAIGTPASSEPTAKPTGEVNGGSVAAKAPLGVEPAHRAEPSAANRAADQPSRTTARVVPPVSAPVSKAEEVTIPSLKPARATILSPRNGETVGPDIMVQGVVFGLGDQQVFLGIRQGNGSIYPRGELFPNADGEWSIKLKSSKEKTFEILVVTSTSKEATQVLRDQRSRDDGLSVLPGGASISSSVVTLKKQGKIGSIFNPIRKEGTDSPISQ